MLISAPLLRAMRGDSVSELIPGALRGASLPVDAEESEPAPDASSSHRPEVLGLTIGPDGLSAVALGATVECPAGLTDCDPASGEGRRRCVNDEIALSRCPRGLDC